MSTSSHYRFGSTSELTPASRYFRNGGLVPKLSGWKWTEVEPHPEPGKLAEWG
jgi:hypothetical protein